MHAIAWRTFRATQRVPVRPACRIIAGVRHTLPPTRKFHRSAISFQAPEEPPKGTGSPAADSKGKGVKNGAISEAAEQPGTESQPETAVTNGENPRETGRKRFRTDYGSAVNRASRNKKSTGVPPVVLPTWLSKRNIKLAGEQVKLSGRVEVDSPGNLALDLGSWRKLLTAEERTALRTRLGEISEMSLQITKNMEISKAEADAYSSTDALRYLESMKEINGKLDAWRKTMDDEIAAALSEVFTKKSTKPAIDGAEAIDENSAEAENKQLEELPQSSTKSLAALFDTIEEVKDGYSLPGGQFREIVLTLRAALALEAPEGIDIKDVSRPATLLLHPKDGGIFYLDSIVEQAADLLHADLLRLDSQDLAEIVGSYIGENVAWTSKKSTSLLGYDSHEFAGRMEAINSEVVEDVENPPEDEDDLDRPRPRPRRSKNTTILPKRPETAYVSSYFLSPQDSSKRLKSMLSALSKPFLSSTEEQSNAQQASSSGGRTSSGTDAWIDLKITTALEALLDSVDKKRKLEDHTAKSLGSSGLIVQIRDFKELTSIPAGSTLMSKFEEVIKKRWQGGERIALVGTTSAINQIADFTKADIETLQSNPPDAKHRTIVVVPSPERDTERLDADDRAHITAVNIRNIEYMVSKLSGAPAGETLSLDNINTITPEVKSALRANLEDSVWPHDKVYRVATLILGQLNSSTEMVGPEFIKAFELIRSNDEIRYAWVKAERKKLVEEAESTETKQSASMGSSAINRKPTKQRIQQLKENCNFHEKKLLSGVVYPDDIKTAFSDVRAPPETIDALKTLTSLSLIRPEAFSYGVLATDRIPGLLLYGPPGTGKTMLAKAVAKESGATVLDVSGADLSNMYVGEGEKNVKALFSLAKKLTPCVVFIDEADAIFGSRGGDSSKRASHRELINQFLREWDGMNDMSAFIMVATNRPFDLDDAVLRRLPRRLLVDLPTEKDREAILKIHLANEVLDESVSLANIAKQTPFYSGSDLKNVSVAAALACVREENEIASTPPNVEPYTYPTRRTLSKRHFDKALEEISASISEDMSTLTAVRKFDEKYGDRKGRRKKRAALGFGGLIETEKDSEAGRVRKVEVLS